MALTDWSWRTHYRVWEADRQVFLFPENWIEPDLRSPSQPPINLDDLAKAARERRTSALFTSAHPAAALLAARTVAADLGRNLYRVELTRVVSKYIGETEKNIDRVFEAAANATAVLLFDEADALFGKRSDVKDSHDRFANQEVSYLLKRIEEFDGLAILATNANRNTSAALAGRFSRVVELPA